MVGSILPLKITDAEVHRRGVRLVGPVSLELGRNGNTIVMGPNGSGKSSLLRMMHGLERLRGGSLSWAVPTQDTLMRQAFVFQHPVMMRRSVIDSIAYALTVQGVALSTARARAGVWAERVGLDHSLDRPARTLSGGERQKLALARALIREPEILFLDEPCVNLDGRSTRDIEAVLKGCQKDGTRIVMATHDMGQARRLATEVIFMLNGRVHEMAVAKDFFARPETREAKAFLDGEIVE